LCVCYLFRVLLVFACLFHRLELPIQPQANLEIVEALGGGATGIVKRGKYGTTDVAVKQIPIMAIGEQADSTFIRECKIISRYKRANPLRSANPLQMICWLLL
jgi:hypothetical protein